jgi:hypothetical protein
MGLKYRPKQISRTTQNSPYQLLQKTKKSALEAAFIFTSFKKSNNEKFEFDHQINGSFDPAHNDSYSFRSKRHLVLSPIRPTGGKHV